MTSAPLFGLSDQLVAMTRTRRPARGSRSAGAWKIDGSAAFEIKRGSTSSIPSARCASRLYRDCTIVASASSRLISAIRASVPSSKPRYVAIGPSTRWTKRTSSRAKRRSRRKSKLKELKRQALVPAESLFTSTVRPRRSSSDTSARRNWCPPPVGGGANSWKSATSAAPRREKRTRSISVETSRATAPAPRRARAITPRPVMPKRSRRRRHPRATGASRSHTAPTSDGARPSRGPASRGQPRARDRRARP